MEATEPQKEEHTILSARKIYVEVNSILG